MQKTLCRMLAAVMLVTALSGCNKATKAPTLNGVSLQSYAIVYAENDTDYALRAAEYIRDQILSRTGLELPVQEDSQVTAEYEIVVGDTQREISARLDAQTGANCFAIASDEKQIALEGDYFLIAAAAYYFVQTYIPGDVFHTQTPKEATLCQPITEKPNNYIFLIGDGMGFNHTKLFENPPFARNPEEAPTDGEDIFYGYLLGNEGAARTNSLTGITDSAAAGTALATGYKTYNGYIGLDSNEQPVQSLTELANDLGLATAVMSTEASTGATPATFSAHVLSREEKADIRKSQFAIEEAGTLINCSFDVYQPALLERRMEGEILKTLSQLEQDPEGFFLMYEEAHIDKHSHNNDMDHTFLAISRFNQAIGLMMEYACYHPDTFVLITADHETGKLLPAADGTMAFNHDNHTDQDVPVFTFGQGSEKFRDVTVENTQIPKTIAKMWGVADFGDPAAEPALP